MGVVVGVFLFFFYFNQRVSVNREITRKEEE